MSKKLHQYLNKCMIAIEPFFSNNMASVTEKDIHVLRVSIKKIKALFKIINNLSDHFNREKVLRPFEELFDQAGKVREAQLKRKLLPTPAYPLTARYRTSLEAKEAAGSRKLVSMLGAVKWKILQQQVKKAKVAIEEIKTRSVVSFVKIKRKELFSTFSNTILTSGNLHDMRKDIKELRYDLQMLREKSPLPFTDAFQELVGRWHDHQILLASFSGFVSQVPVNDTERNNAATIKQKIQKQLLTAFTRIQAAREKIVKKM